MTELRKCETGCMRYDGGEVRHNEHCVFYPESFTKMYDDLEAKVDKFREYSNKDMLTIKGLQIEVAELKKDIERRQVAARTNLDTALSHREGFLSDIKDLTFRNDSLRECLEFYAGKNVDFSNEEEVVKFKKALEKDSWGNYARLKLLTGE